MTSGSLRLQLQAAAEPRNDRCKTLCSKCDVLPARRRLGEHISVSSFFKHNVHWTMLISRQCVVICCKVEHVADLHETRRRVAVSGKLRQRWETHFIFSQVFGHDAPEQRLVLFAIGRCYNPRLTFEFLEGQRVQREQLVLQLRHIHRAQRGIVGLNLRALRSHRNE